MTTPSGDLLRPPSPLISISAKRSVHRQVACAKCRWEANPIFGNGKRSFFRRRAGGQPSPFVPEWFVADGRLGSSSNLAGARSGMHMDLLGRQRLTAFRAHHHRVEHLAAVLMFMKQRPATGIDHVGITPVDDRNDHQIKAEAFLAKAIFVS